jgi:hypothetical protein
MKSAQQQESPDRELISEFESGLAALRERIESPARGHR